ncbi:hypothetical protein [Absidia glauca]|uniref:Vps52-domain-containing protein n=1 Tax=Absidia glauca TaxID=4829 RepID=A0A168MML3_ABSGL|nr:hypothetical protein [Absidia glauca]
MHFDEATAQTSTIKSSLIDTGTNNTQSAATTNNLQKHDVPVALRELDLLLDGSSPPPPPSVSDHTDNDNTPADSSIPTTDSNNDVQAFLDDDLFGDMSFDEVDDRISAFQEDEFVRQALEKGMDLREYARDIERQKELAQRNLENDYVQNIESFVDLHSEIKACDQVLETMEELLNVFQSDLGNISGEIQSLQERSSQMSIRLRNRKVVETRLGKVLQGTVIPPYVIKKITESDVDEVWLQYLLGINKQMRFVKTNQNKPIKAFRNMGPELEKLRLKAASTIRDFFISRIHSLCVPNTNIQIMQQSVFLKYKELHMFVMERHQDVAAEIRQTYINSLRWYFHNHFDRYAKGLAKLQMAAADKSDLIGAEEQGRKGGGLFGSSKTTLKDKTNLFSLGDRMDTLRLQDPGVILVHVAEDKDMRYQFEQLFRSLNLTMIDNASSEYLFIYEFFSKDPNTAADIAKTVFQQIFDTTEKTGLNFTKSYVESSYDTVGILLCIRINTQLALELQRRHVPALEGYTNSTNMLLWPRFQYLMTLHVDSLRKLANNKTVINSIKDIHPHYVTRRYAEFAASLLVLNDGYDDAILANSVRKLRNEFEGLLSRMSNEFSDTLRRTAFLINNYDLIVSVFQEAHNRTVDTELEHVKQILALHVGGFVDEQLKPYFGSIMDCVKKCERDAGKMEIEQGKSTAPFEIMSD